MARHKKLRRLNREAESLSDTEQLLAGTYNAVI